ncbi:Heat Labile Enterotoxin Type Iib, partial [Metarhizium majus ARSEF 297]
MKRSARPVTLFALMIGLCFQAYADPTETLPADVLGELRGPVHLLDTLSHSKLGPLEKRAWLERPPKLMPPPKIVYRGDKRSPDEIRAIGGFLPSSEVEPTNDNHGFSLFKHHVAGNAGGKRVTAYVSTTRFFQIGLAYANMASDEGGWIYQIQATPNMIDSDGTLLKGRRYSNEFELSALGGIPWAQVKAAVKIGPGMQGPSYYKPGATTWNKITWEDFQKTFPDKQWVENKDYNSAFDRFKASLGQPQLAGWFDKDHEEYKSQCPWNLTQLQTIQEYYMDFMNQVGEPVGWTGTYPLVLTKGRTAA